MQLQTTKRKFFNPAKPKQVCNIKGIKTQQGSNTLQNVKLGVVFSRPASSRPPGSLCVSMNTLSPLQLTAGNSL